MSQRIIKLKTPALNLIKWIIIDRGFENAEENIEELLQGLGVESKGAAKALKYFIFQELLYAEYKISCDIITNLEKKLFNAMFNNRKNITNIFSRDEIDEHRNLFMILDDEFKNHIRSKTNNITRKILKVAMDGSDPCVSIV